jgi:tetratricopeptide (TPR) repeat protein
MANDSYKLGDLHRAIEHLHQALAVATDGENLMRLANAHMALGITERDAGHIKEAIAHSDRALTIHQRIGQERIASLVLTNLGDAYFAAGDLEKARDYQAKCLERGRLYNDQVMISAAATQLARYALVGGDLEEAMTLARQGQAASARAGDHLYQATGLALEASAVERQGRRRTADRLFWEAFRLLLDREAATKLSEICAMYSELLQGRGDRDGALKFLRMAYERDFHGIAEHFRRFARNQPAITR